MLLSLFISYAVASTKPQDFIVDPNIKAHWDGHAERWYFTTIGSIRDYSSDRYSVQSTNGRSSYQFSKNLQKESMFRQITDKNGTHTHRYRIQDGAVTSITECATRTEPTLLGLSSKSVHECVYMDDTYCNKMISSKLAELEKPSSATRVDVVIRDGSEDLSATATKKQREAVIKAAERSGLDYRNRYFVHSNDALESVKDAFSGDIVNLVRDEIPSSRVPQVITTIKKLCSELRSIPESDTKAKSEGSAAQ